MCASFYLSLKQFNVDIIFFNSLGPEEHSANFFTDVPRQIFALMRKNFILAYRNRTATFLRIFSSFFFILLIFLVNEGLKARFAIDPYYKDYPQPPREPIEGIPACTPKAGAKVCNTFVYTPAPDDSGKGFVPDTSYATLAQFAANTTCPSPARCAEMFRVHRVVLNILSGNTFKGQPAPIPARSVLGFRNQTALDDFLFANPNRAQGGYVFAAQSDTAVTFTVQLNSTSSQIRGVWERPYLAVGLPLQAQAYRAIARVFDPAARMDLATQLFAHPAFAVSTFEGVIAPLFLLGCEPPARHSPACHLPRARAADTRHPPLLCHLPRRSRSQTACPPLQAQCSRL
jgi:hypothetical protein